MAASPAILRRTERIHAAHAAVAALESAEFAIPARQLHALIDEATEDYSLVQVPSPDAVRSFGRVLRQIQSTVSPSLTLTPSGGIWAEWCESTRRSVAIFVGQDGRARLGAVLMVQEGCRLPLLLEFEGDLDSVLCRLASDPDLRWLAASPHA